MADVTLPDVLSKVGCRQRREIESGIFTLGQHDWMRLLDNLYWPASFEGKRVLDIGGWDRALSFECERRGVLEVIMIEPTPSSTTGFDLTKSYLKPEINLIKTTIYDLDLRVEKALTSCA